MCNLGVNIASVATVNRTVVGTSEVKTAAVANTARRFLYLYNAGGANAFFDFDRTPTTTDSPKLPPGEYVTYDNAVPSGELNILLQGTAHTCIVWEGESNA